MWRAVSLVFFTLVAAANHTAVADAGPRFAAITVDARNGKLLFAQDPDGIRHPASLTKMMTLYLLFSDLKSGKVKLDSPIRMSVRAANMAPSKLGVVPGDSIPVETAIRAIVVKSANDVACAVAETLGGSERDFAARMTRTARAIGMSRTTFVNASGLPNPAQVTTARDMATLGLRLMRDFPQYYPYFRIQSFTYNGEDVAGHNRLLGKFDGTDGIKTGYVAASGFNLVSSVKRGDKRLVGVVLGGRTGAARDSYMMAMLARYFDTAAEGKTIAAMAGSSKGAIDPVGAAASDDTASKVADAAPTPAPAPAPVTPAKRNKKIAGSSKKDNAGAANATPQVAAAGGSGANDQGDTNEDQADTQPVAQAPAPVPAKPAKGGTIKQVEEAPQPQAQPEVQPQPEAPKVVESKLVDASAAAKLPIQVKTPAEQLADQVTVAALPDAAAAPSWMIHLGDFATKADAQARLQDLRKKVPAVLDGKTAQTVAVENNGTITYRARFIGFDEASATLACKAIKKKKSVCSVQAPS